MSQVPITCYAKKPEFTWCEGIRALAYSNIRRLPARATSYRQKGKKRVLIDS